MIHMGMFEEKRVTHLHTPTYKGSVTTVRNRFDSPSNMLLNTQI